MKLTTGLTILSLVVLAGSSVQAQWDSAETQRSLAGLPPLGVAVEGVNPRAEHTRSATMPRRPPPKPAKGLPKPVPTRPKPKPQTKGPGPWRSAAPAPRSRITPATKSEAVAPDSRRPRSERT